MDPEVDPDLELTLHVIWSLDIDWTGARDGVDPNLRSKRYSPNMDLELKFTPHMIYHEKLMGLEPEME